MNPKKGPTREGSLRTVKQHRSPALCLLCESCFCWPRSFFGGGFRRREWNICTTAHDCSRLPPWRPLPCADRLHLVQQGGDGGARIPCLRTARLRVLCAVACPGNLANLRGCLFPEFAKNGANPVSRPQMLPSGGGRLALDGGRGKRPTSVFWVTASPANRLSGPNDPNRL